MPRRRAAVLWLRIASSLSTQSSEAHLGWRREFAWAAVSSAKTGIPIGLRPSHSHKSSGVASEAAATCAPGLRSASRRNASSKAQSVDNAPESRAFSASGTQIYSAARRIQAVGISGVALLQTGVWAAIAYSTSTTPDPLLSPLWTVGGAGLSALFVGMVNAYLSRSVVELRIRGADAAELLVTTYGFGGFRRTPKALDTRQLVGGPKGDDRSERHWTFGVKMSRDSAPRYYIVDRRRGVIDEHALSALCSTAYGGEKLKVLAHKRQALEMKTRWKEWQNSKRDMV